MVKSMHTQILNTLDPDVGRSAIAAIPRHYNFAEDVLARNLAAGRSNKPAYIDSRGSWSYGQLAERVARFGNLLRGLGIQREQRILICLTDTIDWPTSFLGAVKAGVVAIPVNTLMGEAEYRFILEDSRARLLIVSEELYPLFANLIGCVSAPRTRPRVGQPRLRARTVRGRPASGRCNRVYCADHLRRDVLLALHVGLDRNAESCGACACHPAGSPPLATALTSSASPRTTSSIRCRNCSSPTASAMR